MIAIDEWETRLVKTKTTTYNYCTQHEHEYLITTSPYENERLSRMMDEIDRCIDAMHYCELMTGKPKTMISWSFSHTVGDFSRITITWYEQI